ncbi:MAG: tRNA-dihydrouridine synthase family protein [Bacteroidales bacterium]|nr:tRNA-dihydrouridine synthase family protein [Bacteroidales bacterium]MCF8349931.1 tRNA-dihydrouridine synthase family protein [Bacteroidales bacterium]MCF8375448.1 tRNA-dihydrouridine synthase family protein [Bacteroidales bacterium]MCF8401348.1 tRNA-dihydrouridine synthase family protein [Bacteroidales bacterium]
MIFLAPLQGYTEYFFRNAYARHFGGIDLAIAPFVSLVKGKKVKLNHIKDLWPENNRHMKIIPQVMGREPELFITMAKALEDLGYDSINWNLGCPIRQIARKKRGSGLLPWPDEIDQILSEVIPQINIRFSIKTRIGYESVKEAGPLMEVYNRYPLEYLVIHPRIGTQMYEGEVQMDVFEQCLTVSKNPVVYSGDIWNKDIYRDLCSRFPGLKHWMMGRGLFSDLFLPEKITGVFDEKNMNERFWAFQYDLLEAIQERMRREVNVLNKTKELWTKWAGMFKEKDGILAMIYPVKSLSEMRKVLGEVEHNFCLKP